MTDADLQRLFTGYAAAFMRRDADGLTGNWSFPALISGPGPALACDEAGFRANLAGLFDFYARQGVAGATAQVATVHALADKVVAAHVDYAMTDAGGGLIAAWQTAYLVRDTKRGLRIFAAVSDGELAAWAARGTPLGGRA